MTDAAGVSWDLEFYSATERNADCVACLKSLPKPPQHIFTDVMGWLPRSVRSRLADMQSKAAPPASSTKSDEKEIGADFFHNAAQYLAAAVQASDLHSYCAVHEQMCALVPPGLADDAAARPLWLEAAGNTCTPWSASGRQKGWLDAESLPAFAWGAFLALSQPDLILNECTPRWPAATFFETWIGTHFHVSSLQICPTHLGQPVRRLRLYTVCWKAELADVKSVEKFPGTVEEICHRELTLDGRVWFAAPDHVLQVHLDELLAARQLERPWEPIVDWSAFLTFAARQRLQEVLGSKGRFSSNNVS